MPRTSDFNTFITAALDPAVDQQFTRLETRATRTYANIARSAEAATRATAGLVGGRGTAGLGQQQRGLERQERTIRGVTRASEEYGRASARGARQTRDYGDAVDRTQKRQSAFATSLRTTATTLQIAQGPLGPLAGRLTAAAGALEELTGFRLGIAGLGAALFSAGASAISFAEVEGRLRPLFETQTQINNALDDVTGIARRSRSALNPVVDLYVKLQNAAEGAGIAQSRVNRIVELASKAATLSGGSGQNREAGLLQFSQAAGSGRPLSGDELKSISENIPELAKAIAAGFRNADGSIGTTVGKLRELGEAGELEIGKVIDAIDRSSAKIEERFARLGPNLGVSFTEFGNALTVSVGRLDQAIGATATLATIVSTVAQNLDLVSASVAGVGAGFAAIKLGSLAKDAAAGAQQLARYPVALREIAERRARDRQSESVQARGRKSDLVAEKAQIDAQVTALRAKAQAEAKVANEARRAKSAGVAGVFKGGRFVSEADAMQRLRRTTQDLTLASATQARVGRQLELQTIAVSTAQRRYDAAAANAARRSNVLKNATRGLISAINPLGIVVGLLTTALIAYATATSGAEEAVGRFSSEQKRARDEIGATTKKLLEQDAVLARREVRQRQRDVRTLRDAQTSTRRSVSADLRQLANQTGLSGGRERREIIDVANALEKGAISARRADQLLEPIRRRRPDVFKGNLIKSIFGFDPDELDDTLSQAETAEFDVRTAAVNLTEAQEALSVAERPVGSGRTGRTGGTARTAAELGARAISDALDEGTNSVRAASARRRAAIAELDREFGAKGGKLPVERQEDYLGRRTEIERAYNAEVESIKAGEAAKRDARRAAVRGERVERRNDRDSLTDRTNAALVDLETRRATLSQAAYHAEKVRILGVYDAEIARIDETAAASNRAGAQMIASAREVARAAEQAGERRSDILGRYSEEPRALTRAADDLDDLQKFVDTAVNGVAFVGKTREEIAAIARINPLGAGIYTQAMADADKAAIERGVRKPLADLNLEYQRTAQIQQLMLEGREDEAAAYERAFDLADRLGSVTEDDYASILRNIQAEEGRNRAIERRLRITDMVEGLVGDTRDALEQLVVDFPSRGFAAAGDFFKNMQRRLQQVTAARLVDRLLGDADERVRELVSGKAAIESRTRFFANKTAQAGTAAGRLASALDKASVAAEGFAGGGDPGPASLIQQVGAAGGPSGAGGILSILSGGVGGGISAVLQQAADEIVVTGARPSTGLRDPGPLVDVANILREVERLPTQSVPSEQLALPNSRRALNLVGESFGGELDKVFGTKFLKGVGGEFGTALEGAGEGAIASGFARALGVKQSSTGAAVGGAIGSLLGIPGGGFIGGLVGGTIGGAIKPSKRGSTTIGAGQFGNLDITGTTGNSKAFRQASIEAADSLIANVNRIAEALGGGIDPSRGSVSVGIRDGKYRVDASGRGVTKTKKGAVDFGEDQEAAIAFAIRDLVQDGVITGISQASQTILRSGRDLQTAIEKAAIIESIPRRLLQRTDPVRAAVDELNREFEKMIAVLKEGGATSAQFADAQKLYELERAEAIEQASQAAGDAIDQYLKDLTGGSDSPLRKRDVYGNAQAELQKFVTDIEGGKKVDQNDLLQSARNFEDASRALHGSSQGFFDDFNFLFGLLSKARDNAGLSGQVTNLPPSPFATDQAVQQAIASAGATQVQAIGAQTAALLSGLNLLAGRIEGALLGGGGGGALHGSALALLKNIR